MSSSHWAEQAHPVSNSAFTSLLESCRTVAVLNSSCSSSLFPFSLFSPPPFHHPFFPSSSSLISPPNPPVRKKLSSPDASLGFYAPCVKRFTPPVSGAQGRRHGESRDGSDSLGSFIGGTRGRLHRRVPSVQVTGTWMWCELFSTKRENKRERWRPAAVSVFHKSDRGAAGGRGGFKLATLKPSPDTRLTHL